MSKAKRVLYAGPWVGEFGWELCWWNPLVRLRAKEFEKVIVSGPAASRYLYEFCDEYIALQTDGGYSFCEGQLLEPAPAVDPEWEVLTPDELFRELGEFDLSIIRSPDARGEVPERSWRALGSSGGRSPAPILCSFRPPKTYAGKTYPGKHYPLEQATEVVRLLTAAGLGVAAIGGKENYCPEGAIDSRGISLDRLARMIRAARVVVGPSSGPLHLAQLCQTTIVSWSGSHPGACLRRYHHETGIWNPFHTETSFLLTKEPTPRAIADTVVSVLFSQQLKKRKRRAPYRWSWSAP